MVDPTGLEPATCFLGLTGSCFIEGECIKTVAHKYACCKYCCNLLELCHIYESYRIVNFG
jgi:hypothetical protein